MNNLQQQPEGEDRSNQAVESTPPPTPPAASAPTNVVCSFCDKQLSVKFKECPCKTTFYCMNSGCQKEHWKAVVLEIHA